MQVSATVDIVEERAREMAIEVGAGKFTTDYREIMNDVDAVLLSLPHHLHHPIGMEFLRAGKHVLMEKPLANSERECLDLIELSHRRNLILMVAYCMRFHPIVVRMKDLIANREYGDTFHVSIWTEQFTRGPQDDYWAHKIATVGGGQLFSHGCHYIDILLDFLGNPLEGTHVGTNLGTPWMEREGTSDVSIKFECGAVGYHGGTWGARGTKLRYSIHAQCTEGMLEGDFSNGQLILHRDPTDLSKEGSKCVLLEVEGDSKNVEFEMAHFLDCIEKGTTPLTDAPSSLQGLRVIWRLYEAEENHRVANLRGLGLDQSRFQTMPIT